MSIKLNSSGGGSVTLQEPVTASTRTLDLPDATGTVQVSGNPISGTTASFSGDLSFNSGYGSAATAYGCRAWVNFNGTGVVAIRASGNVTSITDDGVGNYTVNFTNAMPDANYAFFCTTLANRAPGWNSGTKSTTALAVQNTIPATSSNEDVAQFNVAIFR